MFTFISVLLAYMDRHILINIKTSQQKGLVFWRSFLAYFLVFTLSVTTIFLTFYLLLQGLFTQQLIYYLGALLILGFAFFITYQLILYTPAVLKNCTFMIGYALVRVIKSHRQRKTKKKAKVD